MFYRDGVPERLQRGVMDLLVYVVRHRGRTIPKQELIDHVWGGRAVSDAALYNRVWALRRALGDVDGEDRHVSWDYGRGLRFTETAQPLGAEAASDAGEVSRPVALRHDAPGGFLAVEDLANARPILGLYHSFYRTPSWPNAIKCGVTVLSEEADRIAVRTAEYGRDDVVGVRQRARYRGFAQLVGERVYVIEQNTRPPFAICHLAMDAPHRFQPNVLTGMMMGSSWRLGGAPYATRVIWRRVPDGMSARDALKRSGPIPDGDPMLDETVVKSLRPRPLIFQDPAEDP
ncbi:MAG: winged helix-turn-helix domain-containing protein [Pseudomonadota bacterium]